MNNTKQTHILFQWMINPYSYSFHFGNNRTTANLSRCFPSFSFLSEHNEKDWNKKHYLHKKRVFLFIHIVLLSFCWKERTWKKKQSTHSFLFYGRRIHFPFQIHCLNAFGVHYFIFRWWEIFYPSKNKTNLIKKKRRKFSKENHIFHWNHSFFFSSLNKQILSWYSEMIIWWVGFLLWFFHEKIIQSISFQSLHHK